MHINYITNVLFTRARHSLKSSKTICSQPSLNGYAKTCCFDFKVNHRQDGYLRRCSIDAMSLGDSVVMWRLLAPCCCYTLVNPSFHLPHFTPITLLGSDSSFRHLLPAVPPDFLTKIPVVMHASMLYFPVTGGVHPREPRRYVRGVCVREGFVGGE